MIDLQPFLNAAPIVQTHIGAAVCAVGVGPLAVFRRRRDGWHKLLGYFWVVAMATLAVTSFFITGLRPGQFSAIHLLSILVLVSLARGLWLIRHRRIRAHAIHMQALYLQALLGAGLFTFLSGRMMSQVLFSQTPTLGFGCAVFVFGAVYWYWRRQILRLELS
ncbi:MAG: DUF2306 domain-containing protein [Marinovum sp.]|nr:DUF2306 domain-containing protein [Marinovum sp.]